MDVRLLLEGPASLNPDLFPKVQERMDQCRGDGCKAQPIAESEGCRQEKRAVSFVLFHVYGQIWVQNGGHVVFVSRIIIRDSR